MDFIPELDESLLTEDGAQLLDEAWERMMRMDRDESTQILSLSDHDVALLQRYARDVTPEVRKGAIYILAEYGPVGWQDAERWTLDESEDVRLAAFIAFESSALGRLCETDKGRCVGLFVESAKRHHQIPAQAFLLCGTYPELVDLFWAELGPLLDLGDDDLTSSITCGILEDLLAFELVKVDGPQVQSWIRSDSAERKTALLSVVQWLGMKEPWQRKIAVALAHDPAEVVSSAARSLLARYPDAGVGI